MASDILEDEPFPEHKWKQVSRTFPIECSHCGQIIFSPIVKNALKCKDCSLIIHKKCLVTLLTDDSKRICTPPVPQPQRLQTAPGAVIYEENNIRITLDPSADLGLAGLPPHWESRLKAAEITKELILANPKATIQLLTTNSQPQDPQRPLPPDFIVRDISELCAPERPEDVLTDLRKIGEGAFGVVYVSKVRATGLPVAVKVVDIQQKFVRDLCSRELSVMRYLEHDNLVRCFAVFRNPPTDDFTEIWIAMEFLAGGTLSNLIRHVCEFPEPHIAYIASQTLYGLQYMHNKGVVHRDIKSDIYLHC